MQRQSATPTPPSERRTRTERGAVPLVGTKGRHERLKGAHLLQHIVAQVVKGRFQPRDRRLPATVLWVLSESQHQTNRTDQDPR